MIGFLILLIICGAVSMVGLWWASRETVERPKILDDTPTPLPPNKTLAEFFENTDEHGQEKSPD